MLRFRVGGRNEGSAPLFSDLISALYEVHYRLKPGLPPYNAIDQLVVMLRGVKLYYLHVFGMSLSPGIEPGTSHTVGMCSTTQPMCLRLTYSNYSTCKMQCDSS